MMAGTLKIKVDVDFRVGALAIQSANNDKDLIA